MNYILMYNPVSGKRKFHKQIPIIKEYFLNKNLNLDIYCSTKVRDIEDKLSVIDSKYDVVIVAGGDGTVNEAVNGIMRSKNKPALATLPAGTANDVANLLGFKRNKLVKWLDIITETKPILMDVSKLDDRYFVYATAAGILTKISYAISRKRVKKYGYFAYLTNGAKDIFKKYKMKMSINYDDGSIDGEFMLVLALTSRRVGGMILRRFSNSKLDDGKLEMRLIKSVTRFKILKLVLFFITGGMKRGTDIQLRSSYFDITTTDDIVWNTDGERSSCGSIRIETLQQEIKVFASNKSKDKYFT